MAGKEEELSPLVEPESKRMGSEAIGGCGLKRKAEVTEEAAAVDVVMVDRSAGQQLVLALEESEDEEVYEESSDDDDSDEDLEVTFAKIKEKFAQRLLERRARYPGVMYEDRPVEEDSHDDGKPA